MRLRRSLLCLTLATAVPASAADITFWDMPQRGGNSFNEAPPDRAYFQALRDTGATWVRLSPDKWKSAGGRDFLMGDADDYQGLVQADVTTLRRALDDANAAGLKVVLVPLSLPLLRWKQKNDGKVDPRLWQSFDNHVPARRFWNDLAKALKGHPALAAYNLINEPVPEYGAGLAEHASAEAMRQWYTGVQDGPRDLRRFYSELIASIRAVDADMPLMLDAGWYAAADGFNYWPAPLADAKLLYSVHMYEPYAATSAPNQKRTTPYRYPGVVPFGEHSERWDATRVRSYLQQPMDWAKTHGVGPTALWWASSVACGAGPTASATCRMCCRCWSRKRCIGRSTPSARMPGMAWTTSWATGRCRGRTGRRRRRGRPWHRRVRCRRRCSHRSWSG